MKRPRCAYCQRRQLGCVDGVCFDCRLEHKVGEFAPAEPETPEQVRQLWALDRETRRLRRLRPSRL